MGGLQLLQLPTEVLIQIIQAVRIPSIPNTLFNLLLFFSNWEVLINIDKYTLSGTFPRWGLRPPTRGNDVLQNTQHTYALPPPHVQSTRPIGHTDPVWNPDDTGGSRFSRENRMWVHDGNCKFAIGMQNSQ